MYYSASSIEIANYCMMRYFLRYIDPAKPKPLRLSAYVKGSFLHELIENFWIEIDEGIFADRDLRKKIENYRKWNPKKRKAIKPKYDSAETFKDYVRRKWTSVIIANRKTRSLERRIYWKNGYEDENEGWIIREDLQRIAGGLFKRLIEEGPPLYSELPFAFETDNIRFKGFIDEVRIKNAGKDNIVIIRDYKSGFSYAKLEMKRDFDPQLTLYNAGLCSLCIGRDKKTQQFRQNLKMKDFERYIINKKHRVNPSIECQIFMIDSLRDYEDNPSEIKIHISKRQEQDFIELLRRVKTIQKTIDENNISYEFGRKCEFCDMKHVCRERNSNPREKIKDKRGNLLLPLFNPPVVTETKNSNEKQKRFDFRKKKAWK